MSVREQVGLDVRYKFSSTTHHDCLDREEDSICGEQVGRARSAKRVVFELSVDILRYLTAWEEGSRWA